MIFMFKVIHYSYPLQQGFGPVLFLSAPGLAMQETLTDMLLIEKKMSEVNYAMLSIDMQKLTINTWKMNKESSNLSSSDVNNLYG